MAFCILILNIGLGLLTTGFAGKLIVNAANVPDGLTTYVEQPFGTVIVEPVVGATTTTLLSESGPSEICAAPVAAYGVVNVQLYVVI